MTIKYTILVESAPNRFTPTGETWDSRTDDLLTATDAAAAYVASLTPGCHAAQQVKP